MSVCVVYMYIVLYVDIKYSALSADTQFMCTCTVWQHNYTLDSFAMVYIHVCKTMLCEHVHVKQY